MIRKTATELNVGDTFYRETYRKPEPNDPRYTVTRMARFWQHDFFGKQSERIEIHCQNHITGPASITVGPDEAVWITTEPQPAPASSREGRGRIWRSRKQG